MLFGTRSIMFHKDWSRCLSFVTDGSDLSPSVSCPSRGQLIHQQDWDHAVVTPLQHTGHVTVHIIDWIKNTGQAKGAYKTVTPM